MAAPRIGRADRLAQLARELEAEAALGLPPGWPAVTRLLVTSPPPTAPSRKAVVEAAGQLAALLEPLPAALSEVGTRISRHCANTGRDAELAHLVDLVRARTWELFLAIQHLREVGGARAGSP